MGKIGGEKMEDYDPSPPYGQGASPGGYYDPGYGGKPQQQMVTPPQVEKKKKMKQTKIGLGLLMGAIGCMIFSILTSPVPCIGGLMGLGTLGLGISAFILLLLGANAIEKPHKTLLIISLGIMILAFLTSIIIVIMTVSSSLGTLMSGGLTDTITGQEMRDFFKMIRTMAFFSFIPNILFAVSYALILYKPARKWGRPLLGIFIGLALLSSIGVVLINYTLTGNIMDEIDPNRDDYSLDDMESFQKDMTTNSWIAGLLRVPEYILYLIICIGAFLNVKSMEEELKPRSYDRSYNSIL